MNLRIICMVGLVLVAGCGSTEVEVVQPLKLDFSKYEPLAMDVRQIVFEERQPMPTTEDVTDEFPTDFPAMVKQWSDQSLRPVGNEGIMTVVIKEYAVVEQPLLTDPGFIDRIKNVPSHRYLSEAVIELRATHPSRTTSVFNGVVSLDRIDTLLIKDGDIGRYRLFNKIVSDFITGFDQRARKLITTEGKAFTVQP